MEAKADGNSMSLQPAKPTNMLRKPMYGRVDMVEMVRATAWRSEMVEA